MQRGNTEKYSILYLFVPINKSDGLFRRFVK